MSILSRVLTAFRAALLPFSAAACLASMAAGAQTVALENPQPGSFQSGIGLLSGWSCLGPAIAIAIDGAAPLNVPYGSSRADTAGVCGAGNTQTGFGLLLNFNTLGAGAHRAQLFVNGAAVGSPTPFVVTVPAGEFLSGAAKQVTVADFPSAGQTVALTWQQAQQNFAIAATVNKLETSPAKAGIVSSLENPQPGSFQSGIGLLSGWSCQGPAIAIGIDGAAPLSAPYGSARADTAQVCGAANIATGFGLLINFNTLGTGTHSAQLYVNGAPQGSATPFVVAVPAGEFLSGVDRQVTVSDFPAAGGTTVLTWQQSQQNFAIRSVTPPPLPASPSLAAQCAVPRGPGIINPATGKPYPDNQGSLATENAWIRSYVNETYLWYDEVPAIDPSSYLIGATVPYVQTSNNVRGTVRLDSNYKAVDAYFNSQRTPLFTASGRPKDPFHFTYVTSDWIALSQSGNVAGFGFQAALLAASPPRDIRVAYTEPDSVAAQNNLNRGARFLTVNGVDVTSGGSGPGGAADLATLNEALFNPVIGREYTFVVMDQGSSSPRTISMIAGDVTTTPVLTAATLPAPNESVGYILFNEHIATAESGLLSAVNHLKGANSGAGVSDLVLDMRYNGGGFLAIASELASMIAGSAAAGGRTFERESFNDKNPFGLTLAQATTPFFTRTQGFSVPAGRVLPQLNLPRVFVITSSGTCSASEAVINGLRGIGVDVIQIGGTTCGKPYGFFPQDNCGTTYFAIQFKGVNDAGFGDYADGFVPGGSGTVANHLPGCVVADDFTKALGDPTEGRLAAALQYRASGTCPAAGGAKLGGTLADPVLVRSPLRENRFLTPSAP